MIEPCGSPVRSRGCIAVNLTCAFELTRGVAGNDGTIHACFAYIHTLAELFCIIVGVALGNARTLLIRVAILLRTRCKADGQDNQNTRASQSHGGVSDRLSFSAAGPPHVNLFLRRNPLDQAESQLLLTRSANHHISRKARLRLENARRS